MPEGPLLCGGFRVQGRPLPTLPQLPCVYCPAALPALLQDTPTPALLCPNLPCPALAALSAHSNWLSSAAEIKATGKMTYPVAPDNTTKAAFVSAYRYL